MKKLILLTCLLTLSSLFPQKSSGASWWEPAQQQREAAEAQGAVLQNQQRQLQIQQQQEEYRKRQRILDLQLEEEEAKAVERRKKALETPESEEPKKDNE